MARCDRVRVLVVDDRADARLLVRILLEEHPDLEVVAEADGAAAALRALDAAPDVALVDARMPVISGFDLAPQLLERAPHLRIALLSAIVDDRVEALAKAAGMVRCLGKDDLGVLADTVRELAGRQP